VDFGLPDGVHTEIVEPPEAAAVSEPHGTVQAAMASPAGGASLASFRGIRSAVIAVNDKTRPVPHQHLLPPLLGQLESIGLAPEAIRFIIATGAHPPMPPEQFPSILPEQILARYTVLCHDVDDLSSLLYMGTTGRGTPVWVNRFFAEADLKIVVGNLEPHQFQGYSGGVKGAAIGLAGRATIDANHALMLDPDARLGHFHGNPARQDVEEIGRQIGVDFALNALLNGEEQLLGAIAGEPRAVMEDGIPLCLDLCQVPVGGLFDLVIASPGGHPKDLNLYQSQKALAHASLVTRDGGAVILVAACPDGIGSRSYEAWMVGVRSHQEVLARFKRETFRVGPHKAYLIARDARHVDPILVSDIDASQVRHLLFMPANSVDEALEYARSSLRSSARIGIMPRASSTIPYIDS
jgi:nickel-dependent lactate racemase